MFVKYQLKSERDIICGVYDLLSVVNSEVSRELKDVHRGDFILTYLFQR